VGAGPAGAARGGVLVQVSESYSPSSEQSQAGGLREGVFPSIHAIMSFFNNIPPLLLVVCHQPPSPPKKNNQKPQNSRGYVTQLVFVCETCLEQSQARTSSSNTTTTSSSSSSAAAASSSSAAAAAAGGGGEGKEDDHDDDDSMLHGICVSCAHNCHGILGHRLRNLGEKRNFRCGRCLRGVWGGSGVG
jgi:hypothetical protein